MREINGIRSKECNRLGVATRMIERGAQYQFTRDEFLEIGYQVPNLGVMNGWRYCYTQREREL